MRHELQIYDGTMREVCGDLVQFRPALRGEPATEAPERKGMRGRPKMNCDGAVSAPKCSSSKDGFYETR